MIVADFSNLTFPLYRFEYVNVFNGVNFKVKERHVSLILVSNKSDV